MRFKENGAFGKASCKLQAEHSPGEHTVVLAKVTAWIQRYTGPLRVLRFSQTHQNSLILKHMTKSAKTCFLVKHWNIFDFKHLDFGVYVLQIYCISPREFLTWRSLPAQIKDFVKVRLLKQTPLDKGKGVKTRDQQTLFQYVTSLKTHTHTHAFTSKTWIHKHTFIYKVMVGRWLLWQPCKGGWGVLLHCRDRRRQRGKEYEQYEGKIYI